MRSSALPRLLSAGLVLILTTSACGFFAVQNEVSIKKVAVDLTFGSGIDEAPPFSLPPLPPTPTLPPLPTLTPQCADGLDNDGDGLIDFPLDLGCDSRDDDNETDPPPPLCGPTTAIAARDATESSPTYPDNLPVEGTYLFHHLGNFESGTAFSGFREAVISNAGQNGEGFSFVIEYGLNRMRLSFDSQPVTLDTPAGEATNPEAGLYLTGIDFPENPADPFTRHLNFRPNPSLKLITYPIQAGLTETAEGIDNEPKTDTGAPNPIGGNLLAPSGNSLTSRFRVGSAETVIVCEELARAYKSTWDLQITGEYNVRIIGTFWMATQYGGFPIRADYLVVGDLIAGNFLDNLAKLDPGDYI